MAAFHQGNIIFSRKEIDGVYNKKLSQFGPKFAIQVHVANNINYSPVLVDNTEHTLSSMTAGMPPSLRFIRLQNEFELLMERMCPKVALFRRGDIIYNPDDVDSRVLLYVVSGNAEVVFNTKKGGPETKSARILIGKGDCFGERNFLLGLEKETPSSFLLKVLENKTQTSGPSLQASTDEVQVKWQAIHRFCRPKCGNDPYMMNTDQIFGYSGHVWSNIGKHTRNSCSRCGNYF